jgi:hypothetical protein
MLQPVITSEINTLKKCLTFSLIFKNMYEKLMEKYLRIERANHLGIDILFSPIPCNIRNHKNDKEEEMRATDRWGALLIRLALLALIR